LPRNPEIVREVFTDAKHDGVTRFPGKRIEPGAPILLPRREKKRRLRRQGDGAAEGASHDDLKLVGFAFRRFTFGGSRKSYRDKARQKHSGTEISSQRGERQGRSLRGFRAEQGDCPPWECGG